MSAITGPISTLPGALHSVPDGVMCDEHPDRPATHRMQGETDSFGCELIDMCDECHAEHKKEMAAYREQTRHGQCEWCQKAATDLRDRRDYEEGSCGRVSRVWSMRRPAEQGSRRGT